MVHSRPPWCTGWAAACASAALALAASCHAAPAPGAQLALSSGGLQYLASSFEPALVAAVGSLTAPEQKVHKDGFDVHLFDIHTFDFDCNECLAATFSDPSSVGVAASGVSVRLHVHFDYKHTSFPGFGGSGTCDFHADRTSLQLSVALGVSASGQPTAAVQKSTFDLGDLDLSCKGLSGAVLNVIGDIFKDSLKHLIESQAEAAIRGVLGSEIDKLLASLSLTIPLSGGFAEASFALVSPPVVATDSQHLTLPLRGAVLPAAGGAGPVPGPAPLPPVFAPTAADFVQVAVSSWTLESALDTYASGGRLSATVSHDALPSWVPFALNTTDMAVFAPGLAAAYPTARWMQVVASVGPGANVTCGAQSGVAVRAPVTMSFQVLGPAGAAQAFALEGLLTAGADVTFRPAPGGGDVVVSLSPVSLPLRVSASAVGNVTLLPALLNLTVAVLDDVVVPTLNSILEKQGFPLPVVPGLTLSRPRIDLADSAIIVSASFTLAPPETGAATRVALSLRGGLGA